MEVIESTLKIRDIYFTLTEAQKQDFISSNPSLMLDMLELEEQLVYFGIISPGEIERLIRDKKVNNSHRRVGSL